MSRERSDPDEMRPEYEFPPGMGVRGKYHDRYRASATPAITAIASPFVTPVSTAVQHLVARITVAVASPVHPPSPTLQVASFPTGHASQGSPRE